ncbi:hypothetical protein P7K49_010759 [Saguinus oedipus]|uniref:Uncharacterized protein n=1 Tax=Saguinus oedipus TaxID=9490 RepID=A0ABQ9VNQ2_SAGOE|nr:hypothetical protein P7K49_010759 [Saguinus oedipus]
MIVQKIIQLSFWPVSSIVKPDELTEFHFPGSGTCQFESKRGSEWEFRSPAGSASPRYGTTPSALGQARLGGTGGAVSETQLDLLR